MSEVSTKIEDEELKEKSAALMHVVKALYPDSDLAEWVGIINQRERIAMATMKGVSKLATEANKAIEKLQLQEKYVSDLERVLEEMGKLEVGADYYRVKALIEEIKKENKPSIDIDQICIDGVNEWIAELLNYSVSVVGAGRKQATGIGVAQKSGLTTAPVKRSMWDKLRGKGGEDEYRPVSQVQG